MTTSCLGKCLDKPNNVLKELKGKLQLYFMDTQDLLSGDKYIWLSNMVLRQAYFLQRFPSFSFPTRAALCTPTLQAPFKTAFIFLLHKMRHSLWWKALTAAVSVEKSWLNHGPFTSVFVWSRARALSQWCVHMYTRWILCPTGWSSPRQLTDLTVASWTWKEYAASVWQNVELVPLPSLRHLPINFHNSFYNHHLCWIQVNASSGCENRSLFNDVRSKLTVGGEANCKPETWMDFVCVREFCNYASQKKSTGSFYNEVSSHGVR